MEVNLKAPQDAGASTVQFSSSGTAGAAAESARQATDIKVTQTQVSTLKKSSQTERPPLTRQQMETVTSDLTQFMKSMNTDINFSIHEKTGRLIVQVKDSKGTVVKEFPSHELLDTLAAISESIGALLDKKA